MSPPPDVAREASQTASTTALSSKVSILTLGSTRNAIQVGPRRFHSGSYPFSYPNILAKHDVDERTWGEFTRKFSQASAIKAGQTECWLLTLYVLFGLLGLACVAIRNHHVKKRNLADAYAKSFDLVNWIDLWNATVFRPRGLEVGFGLAGTPVDADVVGRHGNVKHATPSRLWRAKGFGRITISAVEPSAKPTSTIGMPEPLKTRSVLDDDD